MRIGIDIRCLMESQYSGISEYTYNLLTHLFRIDQQNQYFLFYNSAQAVKVPVFNLPNVSVKEFQYPNKLFNLSLRFLKIAEIDQLIGGVDVFLIPNFLFLNLSKNSKKVLIVHDLSFELYPEFFTAKKKLWHKLIGPRQLCEQANKIVAISNNTKNDIVELYKINPKKIKVILPGINEQFFKKIEASERSRIKKKYNLPDNYIFSLGNLEPRKNITTLIAAFEKIKNPNCHLVIAGGQGWKYKKMYAHWQNSTSKNQVTFLGYVDALDKPALYQLAKMFVYPSIYEGFGLPPIEAMASGTPVITSFASSLPEAVGEAALMVDPNNVNDLAQTMAQLLVDSNLAEQLKIKGQKRAQEIKWDKAAREIFEIISQV